MNNKEEIYDKKIAPLMTEILKVCKEEGIPMFADFQYSDDGFCTSTIYPDVEGRHIAVKMYDVLHQCKKESGINLDKFIFHIARNYKNTSSVVLNMLGNKPTNQ